MASFPESSGGHSIDMYDAPYLFAYHTEIAPHTDGQHALGTFLTAHKVVLRTVDQMPPNETEAAVTVFDRTVGMYGELYRKWLGQNIESDAAVGFVVDEGNDLAEEFMETYSAAPGHTGQGAGTPDLLALFRQRYMAQQPPITSMTQLQRFRALTVCEALGCVAQPQFDRCLEQNNGGAVELLRRISAAYVLGAMYLSGVGVPNSNEIAHMMQRAHSQAEEFMRSMGMQ